MNAILQWLFDRTPGFMRPAVGWLLDGLRRIISLITSFWNWLGVSVGRWAATVIALTTWAANFARMVHTGLLWLRNVTIPRAISVLRNALLSTIHAIDHILRSLISAGLSTLQRVLQAAINATRVVADAASSFARHWIGQIRATLDALIRAAQHILGGPERLAEWLAGAMIDVLLRHLFAQRERIMSWLLRNSASFTLWLARELETLLLRVLR